MADQDRTTLDSSERTPPDDPRIGDVDPDEEATVTLYLRRRSPLPGGARMTRPQLAASHGAADEDVATVTSFAASAGLRVTATDPARRIVQLTGRLADLTAAFGAELGRYRAGDGREYRGRSGSLGVAANLAGVVTGVFGLDDRPQAHPRRRRPTAGAAPALSYTPVQVAGAYRFPPSADGTGKCVGIVELGGGFREADLDAYFSGLGLPTPAVTAVAVDGGADTPGTPSGPDSEVMLDIEVVGAAAPGARIAVYFAPNTDQGFLDAVTTAVHDTANSPSVLSISWGGAESTWTGQAMTQMEDAFTSAGALGVTVTVAAGDGGSGDGQGDGLAHVDFPASAPHALGCGGTTLELTAGGAVGSEVVWNDTASGGGATGGGVSAVFPVPCWQAAAEVPPSANPGGGSGRGVPDVAGDADPQTGYTVRVDGTTETVGGTSAVAPLWAALVARLDQALGTDVGFLTPRLYAIGLAPGGSAPSGSPAAGAGDGASSGSGAGAAAFADITSGSNGAYSAGPGWDPCTGLGTPRGQELLDALQAGGGTGPLD
jgi:kumamolisin